MEIVDYQPAYKESVRAVCLATASERARTDDTHRAFTFDMYCDEYLDHEIALVLEDRGKACGYVLCAPDFYTWIEHSKPYHDRIRALGASYTDRLAREIDTYRRHADSYPAHLHIDIAPGNTGGGWGGKLVEELVSRLRGRNVPGLMLGVSADNTAAIRFYERHGFEKLVGDDLSLLMGRRLQQKERVRFHQRFKLPGKNGPVSHHGCRRLAIPLSMIAGEPPFGVISARDLHRAMPRRIPAAPKTTGVPAPNGSTLVALPPCIFEVAFASRVHAGEISLLVAGVAHAIPLVTLGVTPAVGTATGNLAQLLFAQLSIPGIVLGEQGLGSIRIGHGRLLLLEFFVNHNLM